MDWIPYTLEKTENRKQNPIHITVSTFKSKLYILYSDRKMLFPFSVFLSVYLPIENRINFFTFHTECRPKRPDGNVATEK